VNNYTIRQYKQIIKEEIEPPKFIPRQEQSFTESEKKQERDKEQRYYKMLAQARKDRLAKIKELDGYSFSNFIEFDGGREMGLPFYHELN
jgi:hypothetical protein